MDVQLRPKTADHDGKTAKHIGKAYANPWCIGTEKIFDVLACMAGREYCLADRSAIPGELDAFQGARRYPG